MVGNTIPKSRHRNDCKPLTSRKQHLLTGHITCYKSSCMEIDDLRSSLWERSTWVLLRSIIVYRVPSVLIGTRYSNPKMEFSLTIKSLRNQVKLRRFTQKNRTLLFNERYIKTVLTYSYKSIQRHRSCHHLCLMKKVYTSESYPSQSNFKVYIFYETFLFTICTVLINVTVCKTFTNRVLL